jgi:phosphate transport system substrate-binding protein
MNASRVVCLGFLLSGGAWAAAGAELAIVGTGDGIEMLQAVGAAFNAEHPASTVTVPPSIGSGGAVAAVGGDRQVLGRVARALSDSEKEQGLCALPLVRIPAAIFVHPDAKIDKLTAEQLSGVFSGQITNWHEVGGDDLRIRVVRREDTDSTLTVLRDTMPGWKELVLTSHSKTALTTQEAVDTVKRVSGAVAFGPYSRALEDGTTIIKIDGRHPRDQGYPSAVTLSLIYKDVRLDDTAAAFLRFAGTPKVQSVLIDGGGVPVAR